MYSPSSLSRGYPLDPVDPAFISELAVNLPAFDLHHEFLYSPDPGLVQGYGLDLPAVVLAVP